MGDFELFDIDENINFIIFMIACLFQLIIMLNLLIAVISDTFDKVQENKTSSDCKERCALMIEVEEFFLWNRTGKDKKRYVHLCRYQQINDEESGDQNQWLGKIRSLKSKISFV
jgi:hypothetical protein